MAVPDLESLDTLDLADLRELVGTLLAELGQLRSEVLALRAENQALKDEIARLKSLPPRPKLKPSGMEKASQARAAWPGRSRRGRGPTLERLTTTEEVVLTAAAPAGSRFKGYETVIVQDLELAARAIRYRRERWLTSSGDTLLAPVPAGIIGGFGPGLRRFVLCAHIQGQVTTERLCALLSGIGIAISKRQVVRLLSQHLEAFAAEDRDVLRAGLSTARWITVDDTAARHANQDGTTTQIGDERFTAFRTGSSKSRQAFLATLRAGHDAYVISDEALAYMRGRNLAGPVLDQLASHPQRIFADAAAWQAHLEELGLTKLTVTPDPVTIATEGALWGAIRHHGLLEGTVIVSDDAGQFRVGEHALCWIHAERLVHKLVPATAEQRRAVALVRHLIWWFYGDLKAYQRDPCRRRAAALRARFDRIFRRRTSYVMLDRLLARLHRRKRELLRVLERPEIPLHTNGSENDLRAVVTKRKISGGTMSEAGRMARDVLLGLLKTCQKLKLSFWHYLGDRLGIPGRPTIPSLPELVRHAAPA
jgi:Transposase IS66 family